MNRSFEARLNKLETALAVREVKYLVRYEHTDDNDQVTWVEWPAGINSVAEAEAAYPDKNIFWIIVHYVRGKTIN